VHPKEIKMVKFKVSTIIRNYIVMPVAEFLSLSPERR
jgi:hypothetical protein